MLYTIIGLSLIDKAISAVDERFDNLQVHHNNFGFIYDMIKLNEMARNELVAKCQNPEEILSHSLMVVMI